MTPQRSRKIARRWLLVAIVAAALNLGLVAVTGSDRHGAFLPLMLLEIFGVVGWSRWSAWAMGYRAALSSSSSELTKAED